MIYVIQNRRTENNQERIITQWQFHATSVATEVLPTLISDHKSGVRSHFRREINTISPVRYERPLPDLSAKEYQLLYKREYLENQPLTKALDSKSTSFVYLQLFKESTPLKGP
jgi:hypothetical protein